jgi:hypothetical protein
LLTAPAWRAASLETGYRIVQAIGSIAFTLAAVPVFVLARRLRMSKGVALAAAALALLLPDGIYAGFVLSEPIAYPLVLGAVAAGVASIVRPSRGARLALVALFALAITARLQFVVLPFCYLLAALWVAVRERRVRAGAQEQWPVLVLLLAGFLAVLALGPSHVLGFYSGVLHIHVHPIAALSPLGRNLMVLVYSGGFLIVPGALLGLALAVARPRSRAELAFGAFAVTTSAALLLEATFLGEPRFAQERYFFYVLPLLGLAFCLYASRGWPLRRMHGALAAGLLLVAALVPLSSFAQNRAAGHSPFLIGVEWLELKLGTGDASLAIALAAGALTLAAFACSWLPRIGTVVALVLAIAVGTASFGAAWAFDRANTRAALERYLPADRSWVDDAHVGPVTLLTSYAGLPAAADSVLFWNRSIQSADVLPGGSSPDDRAADPIRIAPDGTMSAGGLPVRGALLVDGNGSTTVLRAARVRATAKSFTLWSTRGVARAALYMSGRAADGTLAPHAAIVVWPRSRRTGVHGWLELTVTLPRGGRVELASSRHHATRRLKATAGQPLHVRIPACSANGSWSASLSAPALDLGGTRPVAGTASVPVLVEDATACATS